MQVSKNFSNGGNQKNEQKLSDLFMNDLSKYDIFVEKLSDICSKDYLNDFLIFIDYLDKQEQKEFLIENISDCFDNLPNYIDIFDIFLYVYSDGNTQLSKYEVYNTIIQKYKNKKVLYNDEIGQVFSGKELYSKLCYIIKDNGLSFEDFLNCLADIVGFDTSLDISNTTINSILETANDEFMDISDKDICMQTIIKPFLLSNIKIIHQIIENFDDGGGMNDSVFMDTKSVYKNILNELTRFEFGYKMNLGLDNDFSRPIGSQEEYDKSKIDLFLHIGNIIGNNKIIYIEDIKPKTKRINNLKLKYEGKKGNLYDIKEYIHKHLKRLQKDINENRFLEGNKENFYKEKARFLKSTFDDLPYYYKINIYLSKNYKYDLPIFTLKLDKYKKIFDLDGVCVRVDIDPIVIMPSFYVDDTQTNDYEGLLVRLLDSLSVNGDILQGIGYNDPIIGNDDFDEEDDDDFDDEL